MNSRFKSTGGKEIEEKCPITIYVIEITYILTGQDIYWRFIDKKILAILIRLHTYYKRHTYQQFYPYRLDI